MRLDDRGVAPAVARPAVKVAREVGASAYSRTARGLGDEGLVDSVRDVRRRDELGKEVGHVPEEILPLVFYLWFIVNLLPTKSAKSRFRCRYDRFRRKYARSGTKVRLVPLLPMHMRSVECPRSWIGLVRVPLLAYFSAFAWVGQSSWGAVEKYHPSTMAPSFASWLAGARGLGRQARATWTRGACTPHRPSVALFRGCVERTAFGA